MSPRPPSPSVVFGDCLQQGWEDKTYYGSKTISWTETETDSEGRMHRVRRSIYSFLR